MNAAAAGLPPIAVVLDIDGVIAPIGGPTVWGDDTWIGEDEDEGGVHVSPLMCAALDRLHRHGQVGCYWLTDWTYAMRRHLDLLPGRSWGEITAPADGAAHPGECDDDRRNRAPWWKWRALDDWLRRHAEVQGVVWIDDRLRPHHAPSADALVEPRPTWTGNIRLADRADTLLVAPDKRVGLTPDDLSTVTSWIDVHVTRVSHRSRRSGAGDEGPTLTDDARPCAGPGVDRRDRVPDDRVSGARTSAAEP